MLKPITRFLTAPGRVAHKLDWCKSSGSVLNLSITDTRIDLAVASHPSFAEPAQELPSIPLETTTRNNKRILREKVPRELEACMREHAVCGLVVAWPVREEGRCGAACGRVLHTLDHITPVLKVSKPICLYDVNHFMPDEDEWGRAEAYGEACFDKTVHRASEEQYKDKKPLCATTVWDCFVREHWPDLHPNKHFETEDSFLGKPVQEHLFDPAWAVEVKAYHAATL